MRRISNIFQTNSFALSHALTLSIGATLKLPIQFLSLLLFISFFIFHLYFNMQVNPKIKIERDVLKDAKINPQREKSVFYNSTNQFQQYNDNDDDNDNDNDNKQNKSKIATPKILNSRQRFVPHGRLTGLDNISRGEERVTEDTKGFPLK